MKALAIFLGILLLISSCAFALLSPRAFQERRYRPCQADEVANPIGKVCHRYCAKYKALHSDISENCKVWQTDVKDLTKESDFIEFRSAGFILIQETRVK